MRFQSNSIPTVADPFGPFTLGTVACPAAANTTVLANPATGSGWRIRSISFSAATTAYAGANYAVFQGLISGGSIVGSYAQANGIWIIWTGDILIAEGLQVHNVSGQLGTSYMVYRSELLP